MTPAALQALMRKLGHYTGPLDGHFGPLSRGAVIQLMHSSNPVALTAEHYQQSAERLGVEAKAIQAVVAVESGASGFSGGLPLILPEPHKFSKLTERRFDVSHPNLSWPNWDKSKYPKTQAQRWDQLSRLIGLDVDAGFACASYGKFQILGMNYKACGFSSPFEFALAQAQDEECQLLAFEGFIKTNNLVGALRTKDWASFAKGYNGPSYAANKYDVKLARAYATL